MLLVLLLKRSRRIDHPLNLLLRKTALIIGNCDLLRLPRGLLSRRDIENTICIYIKGHLNLRNTTRHWRNPIKLKLPQRIIVLRQSPLTLEHLNENARLIVRVGGKCLTLLARNRRITLNERRHDAPRRLKAHRQRNHVNKQNIRSAVISILRASQNVRLHCCSESHCLIGIHTVIEFLATKIRGQKFTDLRDSRRATHHDNLVNLILAHLGIA